MLREIRQTLKDSYVPVMCRVWIVSICVLSRRHETRKGTVLVGFLTL